MSAEHNPNKPRIYLKTAWIVAISILFFDQILKLLVQNTFSFQEKINIIPGLFNIVYVLNKGAAFGILNNSGLNWQSYLFISISCTTILVVVYLLHFSTKQSSFFYLGLGAILGGALGNLIDRIRIGMVIDFLDFYWRSFHWPAFNLADAAISLGAISLLISFYRRDKNVTHSN